MRADDGVDGRRRLVAEPGLQDRRVRAALTGHAVDDQLVVEPGHVGSSDARDGRHDPDPIQAATERDLAAVPRTRALREAGREGLLLGEMPADPRFALHEEGGRPLLPLCPAGTGGRDRDDHSALGVDHDPQSARPGRVPQGVGHGPAPQLGDDLALLDGRHRAMVARTGLPRRIVMDLRCCDPARLAPP